MVGRDFTDYGVSVVNVGGTGLHRFSRISLRRDEESDGTIGVPVACITDLDIMPNCAPVIVGRIREGEMLPDKTSRRWRVKTDFTKEEFQAYRGAIEEKACGQNVRTFVSDEWTLEYDLAYAGLARDVWIAAHLAGLDDRLNSGSKNCAEVVAEAGSSFLRVCKKRTREEVASAVYALFTRGKRASKAIAAQYLAERLECRVASGELSAEGLKAALPRYLMSAIEYVTGA